MSGNTISRRLGRLGGKVFSPNQMQAMMGEMMDAMFADMALEDRLSFVGAMLPRCLGAIFANLDPSAREQLATTMAERMTSVARAQLPS